MRVLRLIIGIASIFAFVIIFVKSCGRAPESPQDISGAYGFIMGCLFFLAGAIGGSTRKNKLSGIIAGILYIIAAIIGFVNMDAQSHLKSWAIASAAAGVFFLVSSLLMKKDLIYGEKPKFR